MFFFGHLGYARLLDEPVRRRWPLAAVLIGSILPDVIDKTLYLVDRIDFPGTRSIAHTTLFLGLVTAFGLWLHSRFVKGVAFGVLTHVVIDNVGDAFRLEATRLRNGRLLLWPLEGIPFPPTLTLTLNQQLARARGSYFIVTEVTGLLLLIYFLSRDQRRRVNEKRRGQDV